MRRLLRVAAILAAISESSVSGSTDNSAIYEPLFEKHSNSTPVFHNISGETANPLVKTLLSKNDRKLAKRQSNSLPTGTCAPGIPCSNGACCSNTGVCSYAPSSCAPSVCISNCDAKAPCGQYANASNATCPLNVCCSQYGFCGSTNDFCGTGCQESFRGCGPVNEPSCGGDSTSQRTIGYYESWVAQRPCDARTPDDLDLTGITHLNFAFAFFDPSSFQMMPMAAGDPQLYTQFTALKKKKASLQCFISVGGWSFNDAGNVPNTRTAFSDMVGTQSNRQAFVASLSQFMATHNFDGVDIDWQYPAAPDRGGVPADTANYVTFLQELRAAFGTRYGISITLPSSYWYLQEFDVNSMQNAVDWFNFMSYDIHGVWDSTGQFTGPYVRPHTNWTEISQGLDLLWRAGVAPDKVVLGIGWYGRSFTLSDPSCNEPNGICIFSEGGNAGPCTQSAGTLSAAEINAIIAAGGTQQGYDEAAAVKWIKWDSDQWVSYDDGETLQEKIKRANELCLGGTMIWSLDQDDSNSSQLNDMLGIGTASGVSAQEAQEIRDQLSDAQLAADIASSCYWTLCGEDCTTAQGHQKRGAKGGAVGAVAGAAICATVATVAESVFAIFTFGLSLLAAPASVAACAAAGAAIGYVASGTGSTKQPPPAPAPPKVLVVGKPVSPVKTYGQWDKLEFTRSGTNSNCDCAVTYTCRYNVGAAGGWDEASSNSMAKLWAHGLTCDPDLIINAGLLTKDYTAPLFFTTKARCQADEFPMGSLREALKPNPQFIRLVNGPANGRQGGDFKMWRTAVFIPCSEFRKNSCGSTDGGPPITWEIGDPTAGDARLTASSTGSHFIQKYGWDSQTAGSLCFATFSYRSGKKYETSTVSDHGFRAMQNDPMFTNNQYGWPLQVYSTDPDKANGVFPTSVDSVNFMKRDAVQTLLAINGSESARYEPWPIDNLPDDIAALCNAGRNPYVNTATGEVICFADEDMVDVGRVGDRDHDSEPVLRSSPATGTFEASTAIPTKLQAREAHSAKGSLPTTVV